MLIFKVLLVCLVWGGGAKFFSGLKPHDKSSQGPEGSAVLISCHKAEGDTFEIISFIVASLRVSPVGAVVGGKWGGNTMSSKAMIWLRKVRENWVRITCIYHSPQ